VDKFKQTGWGKPSKDRHTPSRYASSGENLTFDTLCLRLFASEICHFHWPPRVILTARPSSHPEFASSAASNFLWLLIALGGPLDVIGSGLFASHPNRSLGLPKRKAQSDPKVAFKG
jgi:hypothetical protein